MSTKVDQQEDLVEAGQYRFRVFGGPGASTTRSQERTARIQKSGEIHIPDVGMELIDSPQWVELLYDDQHNVLGLRPTDATNPRAFRRRRDKKRAHISIFAGRGFTLAHGIDTSATRRYPIEAVDGILVVDLNAGDEAGRGAGRSSSSRERDTEDL